MKLNKTEPTELNRIALNTVKAKSNDLSNSKTCLKRNQKLKCALIDQTAQSKKLTKSSKKIKMIQDNLGKKHCQHKKPGSKLLHNLVLLNFHVHFNLQVFLGSPSTTHFSFLNLFFAEGQVLLSSQGLTLYFCFLMVPL